MCLTTLCRVLLAFVLPYAVVSESDIDVSSRRFGASGVGGRAAGCSGYRRVSCSWRSSRIRDLAGSCLRRGEVLGLHPADVDLSAGTITVRRNRVELLAKPQAFDADPKTDAGKRTVAIP